MNCCCTRVYVPLLCASILALTVRQSVLSITVRRSDQDENCTTWGHWYQSPSRTVRMCVCARARVCVCVCVRARVRACVRVMSSGIAAPYSFKAPYSNSYL
jgi:hypothetical protein